MAQNGDSICLTGGSGQDCGYTMALRVGKRQILFHGGRFSQSRLFDSVTGNQVQEPAACSGSVQRTVTSLTEKTVRPVSNSPHEAHMTPWM